MFTSCILKLTAWCNLDCTYCYMFNQADRTFDRVPRAMAISTAHRTLERIVEHCAFYDLTSFSVVLHGGEPTLWPIESFVQFLERVDRIRCGGLDLTIELQTNGYTIKPELLTLAVRHGVSLGISIDGPPAVHDAYRVNHAGRGSYAAVMRTIDDLVDRGHRDLIAGFLCVANPSLEPAAFLDWADALPVRRLDVLWPIEFNYDNPPWGEAGLEAYRLHPVYGEWFAELFELWWRRDDPDLFIRQFAECLQWHLGSRRHTDTIVNDRLAMFVVNTDGGYELPDYFRSHADGGSRTQLNVEVDRIDVLATDQRVAYCLELGERLPTECHGCEVVGLCGGGFLPGRMARALRVPTLKSVLCYDQYRFFETVEAHVRPQLTRIPITSPAG